MADTIYQFSAKNIDGRDTSMSKYKDKVVMVVNVASQCGLTRCHYAELQEMLAKYRNKGFEVAAFPCNQFGAQEPAPEPEIKQYVKDNFGDAFDLYSKVEVNGEHVPPLYQYLKQGRIDNIEWNFGKFLIGRDGKVINYYNPKMNPNSIEDNVKQALGA